MTDDQHAANIGKIICALARHKQAWGGMNREMPAHDLVHALATMSETTASDLLRHYTEIGLPSHSA